MMHLSAEPSWKMPILKLRVGFAASALEFQELQHAGRGISVRLIMSPLPSPDKRGGN